MSIVVNDSLQTNAPKAQENRAGKFIGGVWQPYASVAEANTSVPSAYRHRALTVCILIGGAIKEYWYKDGIADVNLVEKVGQQGIQGPAGPAGPAGPETVYAVDNGLSPKAGSPQTFQLGGPLVQDTFVEAGDQYFAIYGRNWIDFEVDQGIGEARTGYAWIGLGEEGLVGEGPQFSDGIEKVLRIEVRNELYANHSTWITMSARQLAFWHSKGATVNGYDKTLMPRYHGTLVARVDNLPADVAGNVKLLVAQVLTDAATVEWDYLLGNLATVEIAGSRTLNLTNVPNLSKGTIFVKQGGTGALGFTVPGNLPVGWSLSTEIGAIDKLKFIKDASGTIFWEITNYVAPVILQQLVTPGSFLASPVSGSAINLSWGDVANETAYQIERSGNGVTGWAVIATPAAGVTTYADGGLAPLTAYYYRLIAVGDGTTYTDSDPATADTTTLAAGGDPILNLRFDYAAGLGPTYYLKEGPTNVWGPTPATPATYSNIWRNFSQSDVNEFTAGVNGYALFKYESTCAERAIIALTDLNNGGDYKFDGGYRAGVYIKTGGVVTVIDQDIESEQGTIAVGEYIRVSRTGSVIKCQKSSDLVTWTDLYTYIYSSAAALYIRAAVDVYDYVLNDGSAPTCNRLFFPKYYLYP
jgi:hypothetical protein